MSKRDSQPTHSRRGDVGEPDLLGTTPPEPASRRGYSKRTTAEAEDIELVPFHAYEDGEAADRDD